MKKKARVIDEGLFNMTIVLDEGKLRKRFYSKEKVLKFLDGMFEIAGMKRDGNIFKGGTLAGVGAITMALVKTEWFVPLVKEWTLDEMDGDTVLSTEDVLGDEYFQEEYFKNYDM